MKRIIFLSSVMMLLSGVSYAADSGGLFVEPMLTWERGRGDVNFPSPIDSAETELDGFGLGVRVGGHVYESIFLAADARYSFLTFKDNKLNQDVDAKSWNVGPVVGFQMPTLLGLRVWGGWVATGEVDPDKGQDVKEKFESGQGYRVGAGIKLSVVNVNLEYQKINYSNTRLEELGPLTPGTNFDQVEFDNESMVLSVSFPITI